MTAFTTDQWMILALVFVLGVILGMAFMASPKWKQRWREEVERRAGPTRWGKIAEPSVAAVAG